MNVYLNGCTMLVSEPESDPVPWAQCTLSENFNEEQYLAKIRENNLSRNDEEAQEVVPWSRPDLMEGDFNEEEYLGDAIGHKEEGNGTDGDIIRTLS